MRQVGHFLQVMYHSSGGLRGTPPVKSVADFLMYLFQAGGFSPAPLMVTGQPLLIDWEICPSISVRMKTGYRSAIADRLGNLPINISKDENLS